MREYDNKEEYALRFNYKMTDLQAAMGRVQLRKLGFFVERRREIARLYDVAVCKKGMKPPVWKDGRTQVFYRYVIKCNGDAQALIRQLNSMGVNAARPVYKPLHTYLGLEGFPAAREAWQQAVSIPIYPSLSVEDVQRVSEALLAVA